MEMTNDQTSHTVAVIGLGYVGCVSAGCLAHMGHRVIGVDVNGTKVQLINEGLPTIIEEGIASLIMEQSGKGRLSATTDLSLALEQSDICMICVGTPSNKHGEPDLSHLWSVARQIKEAIAKRDRFLTVVVRSTVPPGTGSAIESVLAKSGKRVGLDFAVVSNPEFLREGSSVEDYFNPPYTLLGTGNETALTALRRVYGGVRAPIVETDREIGEMIKYVNNSYHALKVVFANEIGAVSHSLGIDPRKVMELFCLDRQLNVSSAYLNPGFAYGGSCLPKDVRAIASIARSLNVETAVLPAIERSNAMHIDRALELIAAEGLTRIGVLGLAFKKGTDDLRESPIVKLLERLIGKGYDIRIHDRNVEDSRLIGANKEYMESVVPHLIRLMEPDLEKLKRHSDLIVVAQKNEQYIEFVHNALDTKIVIDLVGISDSLTGFNNYKGLLW
ncbi:nucleotide sugar dehydrogenase [Paenibacillus hemerocallicola]|nr:nucleotide sugar dehydrogenase [Paenibacillus hemerocallicola]